MRELIDCPLHRVLCDLLDACARLEAYQSSILLLERCEPYHWPEGLSLEQRKRRFLSLKQARVRTMANRADYDKARARLGESLATLRLAPGKSEAMKRAEAGRCVECGAAGGDVRGPHHYSECSRKKR